MSQSRPTVKLVLVALAVAVLALVAAGCGSDNNSSSSSTTSSSTAKAGKVAVLLPDSKSSVRWETQDRKYLDEAFTAGRRRSHDRQRRG